MKKKSILLTCDDGYASLGLRIILRALKDTYDLKFAVTQNQQSGVGGLVHVKDGCMWKRSDIEGIEGVVVDGSPRDAIDCIAGVYKDTFDFCVSGMNMGVNIGGAIFSSGTFAAAYSAVNIGLAKKAIGISWDIDFSMQFCDHSEIDEHERFEEHPGKEAVDIVEKALVNDLWGATMLNINIPVKKSKGVRVVKLNVPAFDYWPLGIPDEESGRFTYVSNNHKTVSPPGTDAQAINEGYISITPIDITMTDEVSFKKLKNVFSK